MKKYIDVTREVRQDIMAAFNVTGKMVYYALNFDAKRGESDKAKRIRVYAKQKGGIVMIVAPEVETIHDADGYMRQYFPNGAMIECNKANGNVDVFYKGKMMKQLPGCENQATGRNPKHLCCMDTEGCRHLDYPRALQKVRKTCLCRIIKEVRNGVLR